jgi:hypothetical protein
MRIQGGDIREGDVLTGVETVLGSAFFEKPLRVAKVSGRVGLDMTLEFAQGLPWQPRHKVDIQAHHYFHVEAR